MAQAEIVYAEPGGELKTITWSCGSMTEALLLADDAFRKGIVIQGVGATGIIPAHRVMKVLCSGAGDEPELTEERKASLGGMVEKWAVVADEPCHAGMRCDVLQSFLAELKERLDA